MHDYKWTDDSDEIALVWKLLDKPLTATLGADATHNQRVKHVFGELLEMSMPGDQFVGLLEPEFLNALDIDQYPAYSAFTHEIEKLNGQRAFKQRQLAKLASTDPYADYLAEISEPQTKPVDVPASPVTVQSAPSEPKTTSKRRAPMPASTGEAVESIWYTTDAKRETEYARACKLAKKLHPSQRFDYMHRESQRIFSK